MAGDFQTLERLRQGERGIPAEEAFIFPVPCVTLREEAEWVEAGADRRAIPQAVEPFHRRRPAEPAIDPYGDGRAGVRIARTIISLSCLSM